MASFHSDGLKKDSLHALNVGVPVVRLSGTDGFQSDLELALFSVINKKIILRSAVSFSVPGNTTVNKITLLDGKIFGGVVFETPVNEVVVNPSIVTINTLEVERL